MNRNMPTAFELAFRKANNEDNVDKANVISKTASKKNKNGAKVSRKAQKQPLNPVQKTLQLKNKFKFIVGEIYENEKGPYEVISLDWKNDLMTIKWYTGEQMDTSISFQGKILKRLEFEEQREKITYESICWDCYQNRGKLVRVWKGVHSVCESCGWVQCPKCGACRSPQFGGCKDRIFIKQ